jgi:hypothetical protein
LRDQRSLPGTRRPGERLHVRGDFSRMLGRSKSCSGCLEARALLVPPEGSAPRLREQGSDRMIRIWCRRSSARQDARPSRVSRRVALPAIVALAAGFLAVSTSQAATARRAVDCRTVISGAPWKILASRSGSSYTVVTRGMSCAAAKPWVVRFTHQVGTGLGQVLKGPSGFTCHSFSTASSGDHLVYSGVCARGAHNHPSFGWGPKV